VGGAPVGQRHRQRGELLPVAAVEGGVQARPPLRRAGDAADRLHHLGEPDPAHAERRSRSQPGAPRPGRGQQAGQHAGQRGDPLLGGVVQGSGAVRGLAGAVVLGDRQPGGGPQPVEDRRPESGVQCPAGELQPRNEGEQHRVGRQAGQQVGEGGGRGVDERVGDRTCGHVPPIGPQRERRDQPHRQRQRLVTGRRCVHHLAAWQRPREAVVVERQGPDDGPAAPGSLLQRAVGKQLGRQFARALRDPPDRRRSPVGEEDAALGRSPAEGAGRAVDDHLDRVEPGQSEQDVGPQPLQRGQHPRPGSLPQGQHHLRGEARGRRPLSRPRQPEHGDGAVAAGQLLGELRDRGGLRPGGRGAEPDPTVDRDEGRLVADRQHRGEAHPEPADAADLVPFRRGPQGGQALHPGGVQGRPGVRRPERVPGELEPQPARHSAACGRVGGVLRELDQQPVAVAAADQVLLGVRVLAEAGRGRRPGGEHTVAQPGGVEGVGHAVSMSAGGPSARQVARSGHARLCPAGPSTRG
jgi:hypothetical protein